MLRDERGFTLLEIIFALAILATGFLAVVNLYSAGAKFGAQSDPYLRGTTLAHHKMSELELTGFPEEAGQGTFPDQEGYRWAVQVEPYDSPVNNVEENINLSKVTLAVLWNEGLQEKRVLLTSVNLRGEHYPAADQVLLSQSKAQSGTVNPSAVPTSETNTASGPGTVPTPLDASQPAQPEGFRFDISGFPLDSDQPRTPIGVDKPMP